MITLLKLPKLQNYMRFCMNRNQGESEGFSDERERV
jgi:hypothetical protein